MAGGGFIPIQVACEPGVTAIKPVGPWTALVCPGVQAYLATVACSPSSRLEVDLSECASIDSTAAGLLVMAAVRWRSAAKQGVRLLSPTPTVLLALSRLHVESLFEIVDSVPPGGRKWQALEVRPCGGGELGATIAQTHQSLIDADQRNAADFKVVVEGFQRKPDNNS